LEQVVTDRNVLSGQNTQLWKLIEKQRTGYNQILKELERIRSERDSYKAKLGALNGVPNGVADKRQRERGSRPSLDTLSSVTSINQPTSQNRGSNPRHNSDDIGRHYHK
jgi:RalA-binding protein 1